MITVAAVALVLLHMIDGRVVLINPKQVTQLLSTPPAGGANKVLPDAVRCVIRLSDGSYLSVSEDCDTVRELMGQ
jgi:hypothetical protein